MHINPMPCKTCTQHLMTSFTQLSFCSQFSVGNSAYFIMQHGVHWRSNVLYPRLAWMAAVNLQKWQQSISLDNVIYIPNISRANLDQWPLCIVIGELRVIKWLLMHLEIFGGKCVSSMKKCIFISLEKCFCTVFGEFFEVIFDFTYCHREQPLVHSPLTPANHCRRKAFYLQFSVKLPPIQLLTIFCQITPDTITYNFLSNPKAVLPPMQLLTILKEQSAVCTIYLLWLQLCQASR
jgi:hypothetical protein